MNKKYVGATRYYRGCAKGEAERLDSSLSRRAERIKALFLRMTKKTEVYLSMQEKEE
jgi:hypothetical protein